MNPRLEHRYIENLNHLNSIIGLTVISALQEQYFFEGKLDSESMGTLKLEFSDGLELTFGCDTDAESLSIRSGGFTDKGTLESDFDDNRYKWKVQPYLSKTELAKFGRIKNCQIELLSNKFGTIQSGCRIIFENLDYLNIWTVHADNIFYGMNKIPPYYGNENLKIELTDIKTLHNKK